MHKTPVIGRCEEWINLQNYYKPKTMAGGLYCVLKE
jgi:hypothetical protein